MRNPTAARQRSGHAPVIASGAIVVPKADRQEHTTMKTQGTRRSTSHVVAAADPDILTEHDLAVVIGGVVICYGPSPRTRPEPVTPPSGNIP